MSVRCRRRSFGTGVDEVSSRLVVTPSQGSRKSQSPLFPHAFAPFFGGLPLFLGVGSAFTTVTAGAEGDASLFFFGLPLFLGSAFSSVAAVVGLERDPAIFVGSAFFIAAAAGAEGKASFLPRFLRSASPVAGARAFWHTFSASPPPSSASKSSPPSSSSKGSFGSFARGGPLCRARSYRVVKLSSGNGVQVESRPLHTRERPQTHVRGGRTGMRTRRRGVVRPTVGRLLEVFCATALGDARDVLNPSVDLDSVVEDFPRDALEVTPKRSLAGPAQTGEAQLTCGACSVEEPIQPLEGMHASRRWTLA